jgi:hypothetical protein
MGIRDIAPEDRPDIGRRIYEARATPMPWHSAFAYVLGEELAGHEGAAFMGLARVHAAENGLQWPPPAPRRWPREVMRRMDPFIRRERNKEMRQHFAEKGAGYRAWRESLGLSIDETARLAAVGPTSVRSLEAGRNIIGSIYNKIWKALHDYERKRAPARDWLILTDGPARFASALTAPA